MTVTRKRQILFSTCRLHYGVHDVNHRTIQLAYDALHDIIIIIKFILTLPTEKMQIYDHSGNNNTVRHCTNDRRMLMTPVMLTTKQSTCRHIQSTYYDATVTSAQSYNFCFMWIVKPLNGRMNPSNVSKRQFAMLAVS